MKWFMKILHITLSNQEKLVYEEKDGKNQMISERESEISEIKKAVMSKNANRYRKAEKLKINVHTGENNKDSKNSRAN